MWTYEVITGADGVVKFASLDAELSLAAIYEDTATWASKGRAAASEMVELEDEE